MSELTWRICHFLPGPSDVGGQSGCLARVTGLARVPRLTREVAEPGSGILVWKRVVVTAAHVVTRWTGQATSPVDRVEIEVGGTRCFAESAAVQAGWFERPPRGPDLAVLLMPVEAANPAMAAVLREPRAGEGGTVYGWLREGLRHTEIGELSFDGDCVEYPSPNLPGFSGGPVMQVSSPPAVVAVHVRNIGNRLGQAERLDEPLIKSAMVALGFTF